MMLGALRFLNVQGMIGLGGSIVLALFLTAARFELRHARKESSRFEQLYRGEVEGRAKDRAAITAATDRARAADRAAAQRVETAQRTIDQERLNAFETRLAAARSRARAILLRPRSELAAADGGGGAAPMRALPGSSGGTAQTANEDRLPATLRADDALTATEQAIQLDELIRWVRAQSAVESSASPR